MIDNIKTAFDNIRAEDKLKTDTMLYLQNAIQSRDKMRARNPIRKFAVVLTTVAIIILSGVFSYNAYFTTFAYVDVDVNPSIGLTLNRFDRVISVHAYNQNGTSILSGLSLKHKRYEDVLFILMETISQSGYIKDDALVSVTLQTTNSNKETKLLTDIQNGITEYITGRHHGVQIEVFSVSGNTQSLAHELNISPALYLAIQELIEVDESATVDSCREHSIIEIRQWVNEHSSNHHGNANAGNNNEGIQDAEQGDGQHENGNSHHGEGH